MEKTYDFESEILAELRCTYSTVTLKVALNIEASEDDVAWAYMSICEKDGITPVPETLNEFPEFRKELEAFCNQCAEDDAVEAFEHRQEELRDREYDPEDFTFRTNQD